MLTRSLEMTVEVVLFERELGSNEAVVIQQASFTG